MSDSPGMRGIIVAHGDMASGLVTAVRHITGADEGVLIPITNRECSPEELSRRIQAALEGGPALVFTDLQTGSCGFAARRLTRDRTDIAVIGGVNLPLLVDFVMHRDMEPAELVERLVQKGRGAIVAFQPTRSDTHGGTALPRG